MDTEEKMTQLSEEKTRQNETRSVRYVNQVLASAVLYIGPMMMGTSFAYTSPAFMDMGKPGSAVALSLQEQSLFGSILTVGALFGSLIAGPVADRLGRKLCHMITCLPCVLGWVMIILGGYVSDERIHVMHFGRFLNGLSVGAISMCCPIYVSELSSPKIRGALGTGFALFINVGILLTYLVGAYLSWQYLALFCATLPVLLVLCIIPISESPIWLIRQNRRNDARKTLLWLRGENANVDEEYDIIEASFKQETEMHAKDFLRPDIYKPFLIVAAMFFFQQSSGITPVVFNAGPIFKSASTSMDPNAATVIIASVMVIGTIVSAVVVDRAGRRILLLISTFFVGVSCFVLGGYYYMKHVDLDLAERFAWLPLLCLMTFIFMYNIGLGPVPWIMSGEMFPSQVRGTATAILAAFIWLCCSVVTKTFLDLQEAIYDHGVFWLFGGFCLLAFVVFRFVPETKGKSLEEIQMVFMGGKNGQCINNDLKLKVLNDHSVY